MSDVGCQIWDVGSRMSDVESRKSDAGCRMAPISFRTFENLYLNSDLWFINFGGQRICNQLDHAPSMVMQSILY